MHCWLLFRLVKVVQQGGLVRTASAAFNLFGSLVGRGGIQCLLLSQEFLHLVAKRLILSNHLVDGKLEQQFIGIFYQ